MKDMLRVVGALISILIAVLFPLLGVYLFTLLW